MPWLRSTKSYSCCDNWESQRSPSFAQTLACAFSFTDRRTAAAVQSLRGWLRFREPDSVRELDRVLRSSSNELFHWHARKRIGDVLPKSQTAAYTPVLLCALAHPSGHVRQEAVPRVAGALRAGLPEDLRQIALEWLLLRRNDWVEAVASVAVEETDQLLVDLPPSLWVGVLALIDGLGSMHRRSQRSFVDALHARMRTSAWLDALLGGAFSWHKPSARLAAGFLLTHPDGQQPHVRDVLLTAKQSGVRLMLARSLGDEVPVEDRMKYIASFEGDGFPAIRSQGLRLRTAWMPETLPEAHDRFLFDRSRLLRLQAQYAIDRAGGSPIARYREELDAMPARAICGVGETGSECDASLLEPYLDHPRSKVRGSAVFALARLMGNKVKPVLIEALVDPSSHVARLAARALQGKVGPSDIRRLAELLRGAPPQHARRNLMTLLIQADHWESLGPLIHEAVRESGAGTGEVSKALDRWIRKFRGWGIRRPEARKVAEMRALLQEARNEVGHERTALLDAITLSA